MKVLLVDDAEGMRKIITSMLKNMGYDDVITAVNGKEALQHLQAADVGMLLTNWSMPVMDGLALVQAVRAQPHYASLPIVMFTSRASRSDVVRALKAGVDGYVAKPFAPVQQREQIDHILQRRVKQRVKHITESFDRLRGAGRLPDPPRRRAGRSAPAPRPLRKPGLSALPGNGSSPPSTTSTAVAHPPLLGVAASDDSGGIARMLGSVGARAKALIVSQDAGRSHRRPPDFGQQQVRREGIPHVKKRRRSPRRCAPVWTVCM